MAVLPHFAFYPKDFSADALVEAMSTLQVGAYILLLCKAWQADPPASLPNDDAVLARYARLSPAEWSAAKAGVLAPFRLGTDNRWHQKRLRQEYEHAVRVRKARSEAGKKGGRPRKPPEEEGQKPIAYQKVKQKESKTLSGSSEKSQEKKTKGRGGGAGGGAGVSEFPAPLDTPEFRAAWDSWLSYHRERRKKLTAETIRRQLSKLAAHGHAAAVWAINQAIERGWQGVFPENYRGTSPNGAAAPDDFDPAENTRRLREEDDL